MPVKKRTMLMENTDIITKEEVVALIEKMAASLRVYQADLLKKNNENKDAILKKAVDGLAEIKATALKLAKADVLGDIGEVKALVEKATNSLNTEMRRLETKLNDSSSIEQLDRRLTDSLKRVEGKIPASMKQLDAVAIRNKLESLSGAERLPVEAIDGIVELIKKEVKANYPQYIPSGGGGGGKVVRYYDISASLNGSTKIFALPAFHHIIQVLSSSAPFNLRPLVDWTVATGQITFTSQIDEAITLATGQTLTIIYAEN